MTPLRIFIGYDDRQNLAYHVACHSIIEHASCPVSITPLKIETLPTELRGLTPFTFSRFLVPWLCDFKGLALFMDVDVLVRGDVGAAVDHIVGEFDDVWIVPHEGEYEYERTSVMLLNCASLKHMTPEWLNAKPSGLHRLEWADRIGHLPKEWNHLVGYDEPNPDAKIAHFTQGLPYNPEITGCEFSAEYQEVMNRALSFQPWQALMAGSKHAMEVDGMMVPRLKMKDATEERETA